MSNTWAEEMVYKYHKEIQKLTKERNQLKQQLEEKDEENHSLINELKWARLLIRELELDNQDKISFAVEQLEKVKEWVIDYSDLKGQNWNHTLDYLHKQIKQLKEK